MVLANKTIILVIIEMLLEPIGRGAYATSVLPGHVVGPVPMLPPRGRCH